MAATQAVARPARRWVASSAPTSDNDSTQKQSVGDYWTDEIGGAVYFCTDDTPGAAVWVGPGSPAVMGPSGGGHASGLTPDTPASAGTTKYLREDATWAVPPGSGGGVSDGDYGDVTVSGTGTVWTVDALPESRITGLVADLAALQPLDADLTAIAALGGTGIAVRTGAGAWALRTLVAPAAGLTIADPSGVAGSPTFALADDLAGLEGLSGTGYAVRTAASTWTTRTFAASGTGLAVTAGDGVASATTYTITPSAVFVAGSPLTTKGDILVYTSTTTRKGVSGVRTATLQENSDQTDGLEWVDAPCLLFGDGNDGNVTIAVGVPITLTIPKSYANLTVNSTLTTAGFGVKVRGTLLFGSGGAIVNNGVSATGSGAGTGAPAGQYGAGGGGAGGAAGGPANGTGTAAVTNSWLALRGSSGKGGNGGTVTGQTGGVGGTPTGPIAARSGIDFHTYDTGHTLGTAGEIALAGGNGGGSGAGSGAGATAGGGGGGGGVCLVHARVVDATAGGATISANGGLGGNASVAGGASAGGGGGGGGGAAILLYGQAVSGTLPTVSATGGTPGNGAGPTGGAGTNGTGGYATSFRVI